MIAVHVQAHVIAHDMGLDRHVESGNFFVADDQFRLGRLPSMMIFARLSASKILPSRSPSLRLELKLSQ